MFCICLKQGIRSGYGKLDDRYTFNCITKEKFEPNKDYVNDVCKNPDKFKNCPTYKEWIRLQGAPKTIKLLTFSIPILFYLVSLSILLTLGKITISDLNNQNLVVFFGIISLIVGFFLSKKT